MVTETEQGFTTNSLKDNTLIKKNKEMILLFARESGSI